MEAPRPNIIWIFGDQHPWHLLGCNGSPNVCTPSIDAIAAAGVNFTSAVAGYPLCCPFRGSLLTGRYPHHVVPGHQYPMDPAQRTIAHVLNDAGYQTAYFGKWHLDGFQEHKGNVTKHVVPPERRGGFQHWVGYENNNAQWDTWVHGGEGKDAFQYKLPDYETDCLTTLLVEYIKNTSEGTDARPFFAVLSVQPPHNPYFAPESFMERHFDLDTFIPGPLQFRENVPSIPRFREAVAKDLAGACAMVENLDWNVGRVLEALDTSGISRDTTIMFFSDHGDMHGSHGHLRKTSPYNESLRIPFVAGNAAAALACQRGEPAPPGGGLTSDAVINHVDIAPTTLAACGVSVPAAMEGTDYAHHLRGEGERAGEPDAACIQSIIPTGQHDCIDKPWRGIVTRDGWKYVCFEGMEWLLFNMNEDPFELQNLAHHGKHFQHKVRLNEMLRERLDGTGDTFMLPDLHAREEKRRALSR